MAMAEMMPMMATTISSSMSEKPRARRSGGAGWITSWLPSFVKFSLTGEAEDTRRSEQRSCQSAGQGKRRMGGEASDARGSVGRSLGRAAGRVAAQLRRLAADAVLVEEVAQGADGELEEFGRARLVGSAARA